MKIEIHNDPHNLVGRSSQVKFVVVENMTDSERDDARRLVLAYRGQHIQLIPPNTRFIAAGIIETTNEEHLVKWGSHSLNYIEPNDQDQAEKLANEIRSLYREWSTHIIQQFTKAHP